MDHVLFVVNYFVKQNLGVAYISGKNSVRGVIVNKGDIYEKMGNNRK